MDDCHGPRLALERAGGRGEALLCGSMYSSAVRGTCTVSPVNLQPTGYLDGWMDSIGQKRQNDFMGALAVKKMWHFNINILMLML